MRDMIQDAVSVAQAVKTFRSLFAAKAPRRVLRDAAGVLIRKVSAYAPPGEAGKLAALFLHAADAAEIMTGQNAQFSTPNTMAELEELFKGTPPDGA